MEGFGALQGALVWRTQSEIDVVSQYSDKCVEAQNFKMNWD